ncbi:MAG: hypothetical protein NWS66_08440 [Saprospiraceae bacterium]|nr:hypothetical protein [Saprospiraceae bacterium]
MRRKPVFLYFEGILKGKYRGHIDIFDSDKKWHNYYNYEIYEGIISLPKSGFVSSIHVEASKVLTDQYSGIPLYEAPLTNNIQLEVSDGDITKLFSAEIYELKLKDISLFNRQPEGINQVFGEIEATAFGYLLTYTEVEEDALDEISVFEDGDILSVPDTSETEMGSVKTIPLEVENMASSEAAASQSGNSNKGNQPQRQAQYKNNHVRYHLGENGGAAQWGPWERNGSGYWNNLLNRWVSWGNHPLFYPLLLLFLALFIYFFPLIPPLFLALLIIGFWIVLLIIIFGLGLTFVVYSSILSGISALLILLTLAVFLNIDFLSENFRWEEYVYVPELEDSPKPDLIKVDPDKFIRHNRVWKDFQGQQYKATVKILESNYSSSLAWHQQYAENMNNENDYERYLSAASKRDSASLTHLYSEMNTLGYNYKLTRKGFAEMLITFVQDIPYTLIVDSNCDPSLYRDNFIRKYLQEGKQCYGYQRFGLLNPAEFTGTLLGDCDTRTLFLYTLFKYFNYDVIILGSQKYGHSILGINLPYHGIHKKVEGKSYFVVETTAQGMYPGILAPSISDMTYWKVNLK